MAAMFSSGDLSEVAARVHPEYLDHQGLGGRPAAGREGFASVVALARTHHDELLVTVEDLVEQGDLAAARLRWLGRRRSGEVTQRVTLEMIRVKDGLAIEHWGGHS